MTRQTATKSQIWSEIKALGNPSDLKWTSPVSTMAEELK